MGARSRDESIRLLLVDDEEMFLELVEALVSSDERVRVVGRARNGRDAVELARVCAPDVIVMDLDMPVMDGIEATRRICRADPAAGVVIFTGSDEERDEARAREVGAVAYVRKAHVAALLLDAIERAAARKSRPHTAHAMAKLEPVSAIP